MDIHKDSRSELEAHLILTHPRGQSFRNTNKRWVALSMACLLMVGNYYSFDNPSALQNFLTDENGDFKLSNVQYNLLYSVYSFPNIILPFFGGIMIDKIGVRIGVILFSLLLIIGQFLFMLGGTIGAYWLMIVGRVVFGVGGESLSVAQTTIVATWFGDRELAFALGMNIAVARLGSTVNTALTPWIYEGTRSYTISLLVGVILCVASFACGLVLCWMDKESDRREGKDGKKDEGSEEESIRFSDFKNLNSSFWLLTLNCMLIYGAFFTFNGNANDCLGKLFYIDSSTAGLYLMVIFIISACVSPFFGILTDKFGKRGTLMIFPMCLYIVALLIILYYPTDVGAGILFPLICTGIFYATYAAIFWPCIPLVVEKKLLGSAYGIVTSLQNLNLAISPLIFGSIQDTTKDNRGGYFWAIAFIIFQSVLGLYSAVALNVVDFYKGNVLDKVRKQNKYDAVRASRQSLAK